MYVPTSGTHFVLVKIARGADTKWQGFQDPHACLICWQNCGTPERPHPMWDHTVLFLIKEATNYSATYELEMPPSVFSPATYITLPRSLRYILNRRTHSWNPVTSQTLDPNCKHSNFTSLLPCFSRTPFYSSLRHQRPSFLQRRTPYPLNLIVFLNALYVHLYIITSITSNINATSRCEMLHWI